jgi:hypothetical protein
LRRRRAAIAAGVSFHFSGGEAQNLYPTLVQVGIAHGLVLI